MGLGTLGTLGTFFRPPRMCARARARVKKKGAKNVPNVPNVPKRLQITWKIRGDVMGDVSATPRNLPPRPTG